MVRILTLLRIYKVLFYLSRLSVYSFSQSRLHISINPPVKCVHVFIIVYGEMGYCYV